VTLLWSKAAPLLLLAPAVALALWWCDRGRRRRLARVIGPRAGSLGRAGRHGWLFPVALLFALLAMLQPRWGEAQRGAGDRGVDVLVCLDVSRSMLAGDVAPSRLEHAKNEIRALTEHAAGDRFGLVVFAGEARLVVPLTRDVASFNALVDGVTPLSVSRGGTDLGAALTTALAALKDATGEHEAVLLLTDGEDHEGRGLRAAEACRARGIAVHCVGYGTARGAKIPVEGGFLKDRAGSDVVSALDATTLRRIGDYTEGPLVDVYERSIVPLARKAFDDRRDDERENRFQWPLLAALCLWMVDLCVRR
jgi:Ca-activated chloride channel family protein